MHTLKAKLQRAGTPRRESSGVGAGAEEQVPEFDDSTSIVLESLARTKWLSLAGLFIYNGDEIGNFWSI